MSIVRPRKRKTIKLKFPRRKKRFGIECGVGRVKDIDPLALAVAHFLDLSEILLDGLRGIDSANDAMSSDTTGLH